MSRAANQLRIIGGSHGGRRLRFPGVRGLRPTADRVRETLFNWLQGEITDSRVLDLFAGSGALGLEALSRGAAEAVFVERARPAAGQLRRNLELLGLGGRGRVVQADARRYIESAEGPFDIVFLDPPFADRLLPGVCQSLERQGLLAPRAWIYLEQDSAQPWAALPANWRPYREGRAGQAAYRLMWREG